jgi:hypothetical protein
MNAILGLSSQESFSWMGCTSPDSCKLTQYHQCDLNTGRRTSPDSLLPLINLQPEDETLKNKAHAKGPVKPQHIIQQVGFTTVSMLHTILIIYLQGLG